jgi:LacI family gluconate utilization system Gnt-I transcriptional repressor
MATRSRATGRVTLNDVAAVAQVSPITASRALRGQPNVAAALVERVQAAAQKLGYVPDPAARALASSRSTQVAVLLPTLVERPYAELLETLQRVLQPAGWQTLIALTQRDPAEEERLLRGLLLHRPAGLVIADAEHSEATRRLLEASAAPCVHVMQAPGAGNRYCVGLSQTEAGHAVTRHLLERGRRRIAFVGAGADPSLRQRVEGYRRALHEAGLYDARREVLDAQASSLALGAQLFEQLHERQRATDAVFFGDDLLAQGALLAALRLHIRVPQQVAMVGFGDAPGSDQMPPPLTSVRAKGGEIGAEAARLLLALLGRQEPAQTAIDVGFELMLRASS